MGLFSKNKAEETKGKDNKVIDFDEAKNNMLRSQENTENDLQEGSDENAENTENTENAENTENTSAEEKNEDNMIKIYDKFGREMYVTKQEWKKNILPNEIIKHWNDSDCLYGDIINAVTDGFASEVIPAAKRLFEIDTLKERCYTVLSIVYFHNDEFKKAQDTLDQYVKMYGETGIILTNLAKVYYAEGDETKGYDTLVKALNLDPNQDNALDWYCSINYEKGGIKKYIDALLEMAQKEGSWRPQMLLASVYLKQNDIEDAKPLISYVLENTDDVGSALATISGDLGQNRFINELIEIICPIYSVEKHGYMAGLNILRAFLLTNDFEQGEKLIGELFKLNRPDLKPQLMYFAGEFDKLKNEEFRGNAAEPSKNDIDIISFTKPLWYYGLNDPNWLLETKESGIKIGFLSLSYKNLMEKQENNLEQEDEIGRLTRSLPLYLSETLYLDTDMRCTTILPVLKGSGWIVSGTDWPDEIVRSYLGEGSGKFDYIITGSMTEEGNNYRTMIEVWSAESNSIVKTAWQDAPKDNFGKAAWKIKDILRKFFEEKGANIKESTFDMKQDSITRYLTQIAQSAVLSCVQSGYMEKDSLWGERNIYDDYLDMAINTEDSEVPKIMLLSAICRARAFGSDVYAEYRDKMYSIIHDETDINSPLFKLSPIFFKNFTESDKFEAVKSKLLATNDGEYADWVNKL